MEATLTLRITDLARGGAGVARDDTGRVIFVPLTAPGDLVRVTIGEEHKRYAQAQLVEVLEASAQRQIPPCSVFGKCGGCQWQHLPYETQWTTKASGVRHALSRVQIDAPADWTEFPAVNPWNYRNRVQMRGVKGSIGFYAAGSNQLVPVESCPISHTKINECLPETRAEGIHLDRPYKVEIEVLPSGAVKKTWNAPHGASGFRQVNDEQNENLRQWIAESLTPGRHLYDCFGGSGNLSLRLAGQMISIDCIDVSAPAVAPEGTPDQYRFHRSAVLPWLIRKKSQPHPKTSSAILDPPREGLGTFISDIAISLEGLGVTEWIAVGCDPDSWARDVSRLVRRGWKLKKAAIFDFFPQTPHVEAAGLLTI